jgi:hypothetical protein
MLAEAVLRVLDDAISELAAATRTERRGRSRHGETRGASSSPCPVAAVAPPDVVDQRGLRSSPGSDPPVPGVRRCQGSSHDGCPSRSKVTSRVADGAGGLAAPPSSRR